ncbi:D-serine ammonia-lyase [Kocuria tytonis]|uniref:Probable D-serine dehydratase n=1 Tax=Kocuria tytonis TaxID=2054280 RepID=A0A495A653_9MICC|nr:D-serine ammonia-lyase [Kocuria tytonis]RKQ35291.1 D-serine ammonia-lyase [Kocuria tytonis]
MSAERPDPPVPAIPPAAGESAPAGTALGSLTASLAGRLAREEPLTWWNPGATDSARGLADSGVDPALVADAAARLERFRPWISAAFPDTAAAGGLIESPVQRAEEWREVAGIRNGRVLLKRDDILPVSGSVKARGGVHEVLQYAESLVVQHGLLPDARRHMCPGESTASPAAAAGESSAHETPDCTAFSSEPFRRLMGEHRVVVGSTGNLGLSIGIVSAALGLHATVHMSTHAQQWKKDLLRSRGVEVVEHATDYTRAVAAGREAAEGDDSVHFVDDEHSLSLFAGYAVAGARVARQLREQDITVDAAHPLYVYLPCGIGGAPGGVAYGLKREFGDAVHCVFVEPTQAPCMLLGLSTGRHDGISVAEIGLSTRTVADGLAVGRPSGFVGRAVQGLIAGCVTATDEQMLAQLRRLYATEGIIVEPSAAAALEALRRVAGSSGRGAPRPADAGAGPATGTGGRGGVPAGATHLAWLTGGGMLPARVRSGYVR